MLDAAIQPFPKCNNLYEAHLWFPSFMCIQTVIVNIIYFPSSLSRALITLTGSFNRINNLSVPTHTHLQENTTDTKLS